MLRQGDAQALTFQDETFDCVSIAFGIRNIPDLRLALLEMYRVTKKGGRVLILEFSKPDNPVLKAGHWLYLQMVVPVVGFLFSGNFKAYRYLTRTIQTFPYGDRFCKILKQMGFINIQPHPLMGGARHYLCRPKIIFLSFEKAKEQMAGLIAAYKPSQSIERIEIRIHPVDMLTWLSIQTDPKLKFTVPIKTTPWLLPALERRHVSGAGAKADLKKIFKKLRGYLTATISLFAMVRGVLF